MKKIIKITLAVTCFAWILLAGISVGLKLHRADMVNKAAVSLKLYDYTAVVDGERLSLWDSGFLSMNDIDKYQISINEQNETVELNTDKARLSPKMPIVLILTAVPVFGIYAIKDIME